eukprot:TRINITY_DN4087_c0_g1_i2.p1 TRINITY_DN4087_c0_g1~~TRINITY_DN4087_c0_g1_i2.p1  ORF type:complete len:264 (-),score=33.83 TRINITY_DN4087_c0_g1_i2:31-822(-)
MNLQHVVKILYCVSVCLVLVYSQPEQWSHFEDWLDGSQVQRESIILDIIPGYRFGIVAARDIQKNEVVVSVPLSITLKTSNLAKNPVFQDLDLQSRISPTNLAGFYIMWERVHQSSPWKPYFDILPTAYDTTIFWSQSELAELQLSRLKDFTMRKKSLIERSFENIFTNWLFIEHEEIFPADLFTFEMWKQALTIVWSRTFSFPDGGALVPLIDMFNADSFDSNYMVRPDLTENSFRYVATRDISKGTHIVAPYGLISIVYIY